MQRADMSCDIATALHDRIAFGVTDRRREIARPNYEGITGAENLFRHLINDIYIGVFQHLESYGIECIAFFVRAHVHVLLNLSGSMVRAVGRMAVRSALRQRYVDNDG